MFCKSTYKSHKVLRGHFSKPSGRKCRQDLIELAVKEGVATKSMDQNQTLSVATSPPSPPPPQPLKISIPKKNLEPNVLAEVCHDSFVKTAESRKASVQIENMNMDASLRAKLQEHYDSKKV